MLCGNGLLFYIQQVLFFIFTLFNLTCYKKDGPEFAEGTHTHLYIYMFLVYAENFYCPSIRNAELDDLNVLQPAWLLQQNVSRPCMIEHTLIPALSHPISWEKIR